MLATLSSDLISFFFYVAREACCMLPYFLLQYISLASFSQLLVSLEVTGVWVHSQFQVFFVVNRFLGTTYFTVMALALKIKFSF